MELTNHWPVVSLGRWAVADLSGQSVYFKLNRPGVVESLRAGVFFASGSREAAMVGIRPIAPDGKATGTYLQIAQSEVDKIERAALTLPYSFTCFA